MKPGTKKRVGSGGFTLIEIAAALAVFGVVAAGLAAGSVAVTRYNRTTRSVSVAASLAQDEIERLRALDPDTNPPALSAGTHVDPKNPLTQAGARGGQFVRQWTVTRDTPGPGLATVVVSVSWTDDTTRSVWLSTFVCQTAGCV